MPTLREIKDYLGIDGDYSDPLLNSLLEAAREMAEGVLRYQIALLNPVPSLVKEALKFAVAYLYSNREQGDMGQLERTLRTLLSSLRKEAF